MFDLTFVIVLFSIMIVLSVVFFFISRVVFRIITITTTVLLILLLIVGVVVIQDAQKLNTELARGPTAYLLDVNGSQTAGFIVYTGSEAAIGFGSEIMTSIIDNPLPMNATNTFTFSIEAFRDHNITNDNRYPAYLTINNILQILESENPFDTYIDIAISNDPYYRTMDQQLANEILIDELNSLYSYDNYLIKSDLFMLTMSRLLSDEGEGTSFIFLEAKRDHVELYPERITMKMIGIIPERLITQTKRVV